MPRLFAGLEIPEEIRDQLSDLERPLPGAKWVDIDDLHITLRFAGDIEGLVAREFEMGLAEIEVDAFELRLEGLGTFGGNDPRSIWAGVAPSEPLEALARACDRAARNAGLAADRQPFKAHVTLARLRNTPAELVARYLGKIGAYRSTGPRPVVNDEALPRLCGKSIRHDGHPDVGGPAGGERDHQAYRLVRIGLRQGARREHAQHKPGYQGGKPPTP